MARRLATYLLVHLAPLFAVWIWASVGHAQLDGGDSTAGYIDSAIISNQVRFRVDAAYNNVAPDRAEFFYAKCGCFANPFGLPALQAALTSLGEFDPDASGPAGQPTPGPIGQPVETSVDYQDIWTYMEYAPTPWLSGFIELPVRFLNPEINNNTAGFADMRVGLKAALLACEDHYLTFQLKTYIPTGDASRGLGTDHVSLEPGLLLFRRCTDKTTLEGELRHWIPIGGTNFAGNVTRYGLGVGHQIYRCCDSHHLTAVAEFVGWTVLGGRKVLRPGPSESAYEDTIVNAKLGARVGLGPKADVYAGYGRALTGQAWYSDIFRIEFRRRF